ncbi:MAG TPA: DNA ligase D [Bryobacteraceae bacterium]|nr:DNA ligase D [Bryobacteraceae bacterium]
MARRGLDEYRQKRNFERTPEPAPDTRPRQVGGKRLRYAIQEHHARRLHFDLRLEWDGVLLSWALTKEPETSPGGKRLAVRTEAHPLAYIDFEGSIPQGQYGGGTVSLWDRGHWDPAGDAGAGLAKGHLRFAIFGQRLHGLWDLVRLKPEGRRENWLFMKAQDDSAAAMPDLQARVKTLQLATLVDRPPEGGAWWHEVKWDGYRLLGYVAGGAAALRSRNGLDWTARFPAIQADLQRLPVHSAVVDMEAVVLDSAGRSRFSALQTALQKGGDPRSILGIAFDLLYIDGEDLRGEPLRHRKDRLRPLLAGLDALRFGDHLAGDGAAMFQECCRNGLEGVVSKHPDSKYTGGRGDGWVKAKCKNRQEFLILGFRGSKGAQELGALYLGFWSGGTLCYAGKTGAGLNGTTARELVAQLRAWKRKTPVLPRVEMAPLPPEEWKAIQWVAPRLAAEVAFAEWTKDGRLRHASLQGVREDKEAKEVVQEEARRRGIVITHPDRIISEQGQITKGDLAEYYDKISGTLLPFLAGRPLSIVRCPDGIAGQCFFQRKPGKGWGAEVKPFRFRRHGKTHEFFYIETAAGLLQLVQMGAIEFHPWAATVDAIERPDRIIFDLDPSPETPFEAVKLAAKDLRIRLRAVGFEAALQCTGGKGLHVGIRLTGQMSWEEAKQWSGDMARQMAEGAPEVYVTTMSKAKRHGKIFIDYFRNDVTATSIAAYSLRARPGLPAAVPLSWRELGRLPAADAIDRKAALRRAARKARPDSD